MGWVKIGGMDMALNKDVTRFYGTLAAFVLVFIGGWRVSSWFNDNDALRRELASPGMMAEVQRRFLREEATTTQPSVPPEQVPHEPVDAVNEIAPATAPAR